MKSYTLVIYDKSNDNINNISLPKEKLLKYMDKLREDYVYMYDSESTSTLSKNDSHDKDVKWIEKMTLGNKEYTLYEFNAGDDLTIIRDEVKNKNIPYTMTPYNNDFKEEKRPSEKTVFQVNKITFDNNREVIGIFPDREIAWSYVMKERDKLSEENKYTYYSREGYLLSTTDIDPILFTVERIDMNYKMDF